MSFSETVIRAAKYIFKGVPKKEVKAEISQIKYENLLSEKIVLITGGGRGIGYDMAKKCISEGAKVIIVGRDENVLVKTKNELGDNCKYITFDLERIEEIETLVQSANKCFARSVNCLICNAGISLHEGELLNVSVEQFEKQFRINIESTYFLVKAVIKENIGDDLNIICVSSERGFQCDDLPYGLTKAAMNSFVRGVSRRYYQQGVRINGIAPGITTSGMTKISSDDNLALERVASGRVFLGEEVAETACFLLSDASKCISGEIIACDAGEYLSSYIH